FKRGRGIMTPSRLLLMEGLAFLTPLLKNRRNIAENERVICLARSIRCVRKFFGMDQSSRLSRGEIVRRAPCSEACNRARIDTSTPLPLQRRSNQVGRSWKVYRAFLRSQRSVVPDCVRSPPERASLRAGLRCE